MRRILVLAAVAIALAGALVANGTSVLSRLSTQDDSATPTVAITPAATPKQTPTATHRPKPSAAPEPTPTADSSGGPLPGTVLTARPAPRRCPAPPCVP